MSLAQPGHCLGVSVEQVAETQPRNSIKFGERAQNPDVRVLRQQGNKSRLVGDKVEEGLIEDQADVQRPTALRNGFQQAPLRQQAGGVVRGAKKQAVQRRSQGIEDGVGQLPAIALPQGILHHLAVHRLQRPPVLRETRNDDHRPPRLKAVDEGEDRFSFAVAGKDMRRRQLMVGSQRLMQLLILNVRVALGAAKTGDDRPPERGRHPQRIDVGAKIQQLAGRNTQQGGGLADIAAMGAFQ